MLYLVRHYSHTYLARLVEVEGKYGYFNLLRIDSEFVSSSTSVTGRGGVSTNRRTVNDYTGDTVKKEMKLVREYTEADRILYNSRIKKEKIQKITIWTILGLMFLASIILLTNMEAFLI